MIEIKMTVFFFKTLVIHTCVNMPWKLGWCNNFGVN
jgi:hypothetical protein